MASRRRRYAEEAYPGQPARVANTTAAPAPSSFAVPAPTATTAAYHPAGPAAAPAGYHPAGFGAAAAPFPPAPTSPALISTPSSHFPPTAPAASAAAPTAHPAPFAAPPFAAAPAAVAAAPPPGFAPSPAAPPAAFSPTPAAGFAPPAAAPPAGFSPAPAAPAAGFSPSAVAPPAQFPPPAGFGATAAPPIGFGASPTPPAGFPPATAGFPPATPAPPAGFGPTAAPPAGFPPATAAPPAGFPPATAAPPAGFGPTAAPPAGFPPATAAPPTGFPPATAAPPTGFSPSASPSSPPAGFSTTAAPPAGFGVSSSSLSGSESSGPSSASIYATSSAPTGFRQGTEGRFWGGGSVEVPDDATLAARKKRSAYPKNPTIPETFAKIPSEATSSSSSSSSSSSAAASSPPPPHTFSSPSSAAMGSPIGTAPPFAAAAPGPSFAPLGLTPAPSVFGPDPAAAFASPFAPSGPAAMVEQAVLQPCPAEFLTLTAECAPNSQKMAGLMGLPLGAIVQPLAPIAPPQVINFGSVGVIRCAECRAYINPYVSFTHGGRNWVCSLCRHPQKVHDAYFCATNTQGIRHDLATHPELTHGAIEFVATQQYAYRPPQAPVYFFLLDVSCAAVQSGMLSAALQAIKASLDRLPAHDGRAQVGIMTFDAAIHCYALGANRSQPQMLVLSELADLFLPTSSDELLVNIVERRALFDKVLDMIPSCFQESKTLECCLDAALKLAVAIVRKIGGKIFVFESGASSGPSVPLKARAQSATAAVNTPKEQGFLKPADNLFQDVGLDASKNHITIELFVMANQPVDLASLQMLCQVTGGNVHYYPELAGECERLYYDVVKLLSSDTALEACLRIRVSNGFKVSKHFGHYFMKNVDLMSTPVVDTESAFAVQIAVDKKELGPDVRQLIVQAALLYTTFSGERRIRILTTAIPVANNLPCVLRGIKTLPSLALVAKIATNKVMTSTLAEVRNMVADGCSAVLKSCTAAGLGHALPANLVNLPLGALTLSKSRALSSAFKQTIDDRVYALAKLRTGSLPWFSRALSPLFLALHTLGPNDGLPDASTGQIVLPTALLPSSEKMERHGVYLLDNAETIFLWFGPDTPDALVQQLFNIPSFKELPITTTQLPTLETPYSIRVVAILNAVRAARFPYGFQPFSLIKSSSPPSLPELRFFESLTADRLAGTPSLPEFHRALTSKVQ